MTTPENPNPERPEQPSPIWNPAGQANEAPREHEGEPPQQSPPRSQGEDQAQGQRQGQPTYANSHQYGQQPPPGYGQQQSGYGQQQPPGYGYPPPPPEYGGQYGTPADRPIGMPPYANWGQRVVAWLIDNLVAAVGIDLLEASYYDWGTGGRAVSWVITVIGVIWSIYNAYLAGQTGQSTGKRMMNIRLARFVDGQVVGAGYGVLRLFMNVVFWVVCLIPGLLNYLWPLWDPRSQTWSDKIASSVVVKTQ